MTWKRTCLHCAKSFRAAHGNKKVCSDLCRKTRCREMTNERSRIRFATDPAYREYMNRKSLVRHHLRWATELGYQEKHNALSRQWKRDKLKDPEYRAKAKQKNREWHLIKRTTDPEWKKRSDEYKRQHRRKQAAIAAAVKELGLINVGDLKC